MVLHALLMISDDIVRPHTSLDDVPAKFANSSLYFQYFQNCVGALDGMHIEAVLGENHDQYRVRKGVKNWNVLACCSFDMLFTYVNDGWEGSVHDTTVLKDSIEILFSTPATRKILFAGFWLSKYTKVFGSV
ncbi:hypothetical protein QQ045_010019 [Rhodiola kirilowii]